MIGQIGKIIIGQLIGLPFIDKYAGVVKPLVYTETTKDKKTIRKTFPVECTMTLDQCKNNSRYLDLVPDISKKSVTYLEDTGLRITKRAGNYIYFSANYDLVCWLNMPLLGFNDCSYSGVAILSILKALPIRPINSGNYHLLNTQMVGQKPKSVNPFAKYSYDEAVNQFLLYPFDYLVLNLQTDFRMDIRCVEIAQLSSALNCISK